MLRAHRCLIPSIVLMGLCAVAGCQSTSRGSPLWSKLSKSNPSKTSDDKDAVAKKAPAKKGDQPIAQASAQQPQAQFTLVPGAEIHWEAKPARDEPGQVTSGTAPIGPDGTIVVGPYGTCLLAGLNMSQATMALEKHLAPYLKSPSVQLSAVMPSNAAPGAIVPVNATTTTLPAPAPTPTPDAGVSFRSTRAN